MPAHAGHILTDDVVVNYKNNDRDDCLHFLTHIDTTCHKLASFVSPTAKRIYTSVFNAWFLKINFNVKHIDVQGFEENKSYKITYKGNKYIYSFISTKFTTGSVALLLHGAFGTYLYTGNFCYHRSFVNSPVLLPVIKEQALTRLYLDNTYYEQPSEFLGFDGIVSKIVELIKAKPTKNFYIYAEKVTMDPLIAEIASRLEEKVYVCQSTMEIMKFLGYESFFTRHAGESRIFIDKALGKKRDFENENIAVHLNRYSESCKIFKKLEIKGNIYDFNFYCHSNHKEICELLGILKPETMTFLFSEIDKTKLSYDFKFKYDLPRNVLFKGVSTKPSINVKCERKPINNHSNLATVINDSIAGSSQDLSCKRLNILKNQDLINLNINNGGKNLTNDVSENKDVSHLPSTEYRCPLRIRKVPEINNVGLSNKSDCNKVDGVNEYTVELIFNDGENNNNSNKANISSKNTCNHYVQSHSSSENFHDYHKSKPIQTLKFIKQQDDNSAGNTVIPNNIKSLSPFVVQTKTGMPFVFNPKLVKQNNLNGTNSKTIEVSKIGMLSNGNKQKTIVVKKKQPCLITVPHGDSQKTELNRIENKKFFLTKKPLVLLQSKTCDTNLNIKKPPALNFSKAFNGSRDDDSVSVPNNSLQIPENSIGESEESISSVSRFCDRVSIQLEVLRNDTIDEDRDSLVGSIKPQPKGDINQPSETHSESHMQGNLPTCNEKDSGDDSIITSLEKSVMENRAKSGSPCILSNDPEHDLVKNNENKFGDNNCQDAANDTHNIISKRSLFDDNGTSRKKLRSNSLRQSLLEPNREHTEPDSLNNCYVLLKRNSFQQSYFYSYKHQCFLPKFSGFKKNDIRPRTMLHALRNLKKLLRNEM